MRKSPILVALAILAVACTTKVEGEDACTIAGTYSLSGVKESGNCPESGGDPNATTTLTISPAEAGSGADFALEIQGLQGACPMAKVDSCKLQGKCDVVLKDALDPRNATGSIQYTWTFDKNGFTGFSALTLPPATSLPKGCSQNATNTATRR